MVESIDQIPELAKDPGPANGSQSGNRLFQEKVHRNCITKLVENKNVGTDVKCKTSHFKLRL